MDAASISPASTASATVTVTATHLVDAEMALEPAAISIIERDLHGVVNVTHFVPSHFILDVQSNHCRGGRKKTKKIKTLIGRLHRKNMYCFYLKKSHTFFPDI